MSAIEVVNMRIEGPETLPIAGLAFRRFRGEEDFPAMLACIQGSKEADGIERTETLEDIVRNYKHLLNSDPYQDVILIEINGDVVGYGRVWWEQDSEGTRRYMQITFLLPAWRGQGIRRALLRANERRLREIAGQHPHDGARFFEAFTADTETQWESLLQEEGYEPVRHGLDMVRPDLENIPDLPLPDGLEVRPVRAEDLPQILAASMEAFRDHYGFSEDAWLQEEKAMLESPDFQPALWQVAWEGDQVAGMVQNFINEQENREYSRKRGYTEGISVRRPWRRRGLARALIARSFQVLKDQGMTEAALGCDAENLHGAVQLYTSMGFRPVKRFTVYRKPMG